MRAYLAEHGERIVLHNLPAYSPNENPIEQVWWHLHEQITRNHCCRSIEAHLNLTLPRINEHGRFKIEGRMYQRLKAPSGEALSVFGGAILLRRVERFIDVP